MTAATVKQPIVAPSALTCAALPTLASATYAVSSAFTANSDQPQDLVAIVEAATTNTPAGNKRLKVFAKISMDGTNFTGGPETGTTTTDEISLIYLGSVPIVASTATRSRECFSIAQVCGFCPYAAKLVFFNDTGVALTDGASAISEITDTVG